jgi:NADH-quinone oxidoreductase subunit J
MSAIGFIVMTLLAVLSALVVIFHRNQVVCALALAANLLALAGFYLLLQAQFIALLQVIVYAGAIMVLILFVIMLLDLRDAAVGAGFVQTWLGVGLATALAAILGLRVFGHGAGVDFGPAAPGFGTVGALGRELFERFFYPFEAISLLLLVAMIGAVLLAKRRL